MIFDYGKWDVIYTAMDIEPARSMHKIMSAEAQLAPGGVLIGVVQIGALHDTRLQVRKFREWMRAVNARRFVSNPDMIVVVTK